MYSKYIYSLPCLEEFDAILKTNTDISFYSTSSLRGDNSVGERKETDQLVRSKA